jgi:hypothetical protein
MLYVFTLFFLSIVISMYHTKHYTGMYSPMARLQFVKHERSNISEACESGTQTTPTAIPISSVSDPIPFCWIGLDKIGNTIIGHSGYVRLSEVYSKTDWIIRDGGRRRHRF